MFGGYARACAVSMAAQGVPVFVDEFGRRHPYVPGVKIADQDTATIGAYHTADISYWLGTQDAYNALRPTRNWTPWDRTLSARMQAAMIALAETGSPNTPGLPWKPWSPGNDTAVWLGDSIEVRPIDVAGQSWLAAHKPASAAQPPRLSRPRD